MPPPDVILASAAAIANGWRSVAVVWHLLLGSLLIALSAGWRPSQRRAGYLLAAPFVSVSAAAWTFGNPFNGAVFVLLILALVGPARRWSGQGIRFGSAISVTSGALLVAFGWGYPHFLEENSWVAYSYAAPLGVLPCPTLSAVIGMTLMLDLLGSRAWATTLAGAGLLYGGIGVFVLGVELDYGLLAGALMLLAAAARFGARSVGADPEERARELPGDELIQRPIATLTHAITVLCSPRDLWPWLAQMGAGSRAGWYSYDWLDNAGRKSATTIVPQLQKLSVGMIFPALPGVTDCFTLLAFEPEKFLILGWTSADDVPPLMTWAFVLERDDCGRTRLIVRVRGGSGYRFRGMPWRSSRWIVPVIHFVMQRRQLLGIAIRAEGVRHLVPPQSTEYEGKQAA